MNKAYFNTGEDIYVVDENGHISEPIEYNDGIEQILIQENFVEEIQERIDEYRSELVHKDVLPTSKQTIIMGLLAITLIFGVNGIDSLVRYGKLFSDIFNMISTMTWAGISLGVIVAINRGFNTIRERCKFLSNNISLMELMLEKETEKLEMMKQNMSNSKTVTIDKPIIVDIDNHERLKILREELDKLTTEETVEPAKQKTL